MATFHKERSTMTHDYKRNGTTTLFAALDVATGKVIGECLPRHRADEFLAFLRKIDRETPAHLDLHLVIDNYATHKTEQGEALARPAQAFQAAFHADIQFVAQTRRAALRRDHAPTHPPRHLPQCRGTRSRDR